ncbi:prepilin peptidase [Pedobacter sp.]|nr:prepilin peptidase [Candidatus Saccharibacteria bacterium]
MTYIVLLILGLCFGSFVNALVWRLHNKRDFVKERSECVRCHHVLAWNDLVPVLSWILLKGKCRYCHKPISKQYPLIELLMAILFVTSYVLWPLGFALVGWVLFGLWLVCLIFLVALAIYDARWMLLPDSLMFPLIGIGVVFGFIRWFGLDEMTIVETIVQLALGAASIGGVYYLLYAVSKGAWVGFGDVKLGIFMGVVLGWQAGLLALVLANIIGLIIILPGLMTKKLSRTSRVPFGPFLIAAFVIAGLISERAIDWYLSVLL